MRDTRKGFTLVELLAVIVILAIIMIIAIPSVLNTMNSAKSKTFKEYVTNVYTKGQTQYLADLLVTTDSDKKGHEVTISGLTVDGTSITSGRIYDITADLGIDSVGSYTGYVLVTKNNNDQMYYVALSDGEYGTEAGDNGFGRFCNYSKDGEPTKVNTTSTYTKSHTKIDTLVASAKLLPNSEVDPSGTVKITVK